MAASASAAALAAAALTATAATAAEAGVSAAEPAAEERTQDGCEILQSVDIIDGAQHTAVVTAAEASGAITAKGTETATSVAAAAATSVVVVIRGTISSAHNGPP